MSESRNATVRPGDVFVERHKGPEAGYFPGRIRVLGVVGDTAHVRLSGSYGPGEDEVSVEWLLCGRFSRGGAQ